MMDFVISILGVLIFFFPSLFGEGYESIKILADNQSGKLVQNTVFEQFSTNCQRLKKRVISVYHGFSPTPVAGKKT